MRRGGGHIKSMGVLIKDLERTLRGNKILFFGCGYPAYYTLFEHHTLKGAVNVPALNLLRLSAP